MRLLNITCKNHRILKDFSLNIPNERFICLSGRNGSGKSSFLDLIEASLFGTISTRISNKKSAFYDVFKSKGYLETVWEYEGNKITLKRTINSNSQLREIYINDSYVEDSTKEEVFNNFINNYFNLDYKTYMALVYTSQDNIGNFLDLTVEDRKRLLFSLFGLDKYDKYSEILEKVHFDLNDKVSFLSSHIEIRKGLLQDYQNKISSLESNLVEVQSSLNELDIEKINKDLDFCKAEIVRIESEVSRNKEKLEKIKELKAQKEDIEKKLDKARNLSLLYKEVELLKEKYVLNLKHIASIKDEILQKEIKSREFHERMMSEKEAFDLRVKNLKIKVDANTKEKNSLLINKMKLNNEIDNIKKDIRELENLSVIVNKVACNDLPNLQESCFLLSNNYQKYKVLSEKNLKSLLLEKEYALKDIEHNLEIINKELDIDNEAIKSLENDYKVITDDIMKQYEVLKKDYESLNNTYETLNNVSDSFYKEIKTKEESFFSLKEDGIGFEDSFIDYLLGSIVLLNNNIQQLEQSLEEFNYSKIDFYKERIIELNKKLESYNLLRDSVVNINAFISNYSSEIESLKKYISNIEKKIAYYKDHLNKINILKENFSSDGLKLIKLDTIAPLLSQMANMFLYDLFGDKFVVSFETIKKLKSGKVADSFIVLVKDIYNGYDFVDISVKSGGEKSILKEVISFSILAQALNYNNLKVKTIFRDETTSPLDEQNAPKYFDLLNGLIERSNVETILFVSHNREIINRSNVNLVFDNGEITIC